MYYSLHNHTEASNARLIDSITKIEDLIQYAFDIGLKGVAITDHETVKAHVRASKYIKKQREKDKRWENFKLIYGNEIYLCRNNLTKENYNKEKDYFFHFILLALDEEGHKLIRKLSTRAYEHSFMRGKMLSVPTYYRDLEEIIKPNQGHIIASSACIGSFMGRSILDNKPDDFLIEWIDYIQSIFGKENFFLELQPSFNEEQIKVNKKLIELSKLLNIPAIVTTDSHYLSKEDRSIHKAYLNSKEGEREVDAFYASAYMMDNKEIHSYMDDSLGKEIVNSLLENTNLIGERVSQFYIEKPFKLPYLPSNEDKELAKNTNFDRLTNEKNPQIWDNFINSKEDADRVFIHRILNKCHSNPEEFESEKSIDRIEIELQTVWDASKKQNIVWSKYFLQVADYIDIAWNEGDTLVGAGRGSGVGFYLNYLLDIIQINPLKEKVPLFFWRFLNPERASILDVDTDIQSNRRNKVIKALQNRYGEKRVIRVMTERTEASKSAILTAARGLGIDVDIAQYIASLIESDRGKQRSLHDTYYGNEEEGFAPNKTFQEEMNKYPELWKVAQKIEGLACGCGIHAGGVIIVDEDITNTNSLIKINSGEWATAWDLHESEEAAGNVKIDLLATMNLTRMRTCLDLLVEYGYVEKKNTLKETYESVLGVYNLDRTSSDMWKMVWDNKIVSLFQFETLVGRQAIQLYRPTSLEELASLNSIMRLMAPEKGMEQPLNKFSHFKNSPKEWEQEMDAYHLTKEEKHLLHKYLDYQYGLCASQEDIMSLIQEPSIGGWSLKQADYLRKSVAKKDKKLYENLTKEYFETVKEKNLSKNLCNYFWNVLVATQRGYSFNLSHTLAYSIIGLQNMNLAYCFPIIFWNTANLIVDSSGVDDNEELEEEIEQDEVVSIFEEEDTENYEYIDSPDRKTKVKRAKKATNYGKIATAIGKFRAIGINILPPDINKSSYTFAPDVEINSITYGLKGIAGVSEDLIKDIINKRPFVSFDDFNNRVKTNKRQMPNLIKSGIFDNIENCSREELMKKYILSVCDQKQRLTLQNMAMLINYDMIPDEMALYAKMFSFNKFLKKNKNGNYCILNGAPAVSFVKNNFGDDAIIEGNKILQKDWDTMYKKGMEPMRIYLKENGKEMLERLNNKLFIEEYEKYGSGNISKWEMDSISFYYHDHELKNINFDIDNFFELPEDPILERTFTTKNGQEIKIFKLNLIAGTVVEKNKLKNTISLLTPTGVVNVKIYKNQYSLFDKQISVKGEDGHKKVIEKSWFSKGTLLLLQGFRRGNDYVLKKYKDSIYPVVSKITSVGEDGRITLQYEREEV